MRKICVVTGSRADYGHLYWLLREIDDDPGLTLQVVATGAHLSEAHGHTVDEIERDGFKISARIDLDIGSDSPVGIAKSTALAVAGMAEAIAELRPDIIVLIGDRYEILAVAHAALLSGVPIAHIHGGEVTEGAIDDSIRHALTKISCFHFVAAKEYARRVVQLGEPPDRVFIVGAPGLEHVHRLKPMTKAELEQSLSFGLGAANFLITYHPVTTDSTATEREIDALLTSLDDFPDAHLVFTGVNADAGNRLVDARIRAYAESSKERAKIFSSLGQRRYLSVMALADVVIGNSSSGIIEAPAMRSATVNIGDRQRGRLQASSIINCPGTAKDIRQAIERALSTVFQKDLHMVSSPYSADNAASAIKERLKQASLADAMIKTFHDLPTEVPVA